MHSDNNSTKIRYVGSYFVSLISMILVLFVLGMYAVMVVYTDTMLDYVKENIGFEVVIKNKVKEADIIKLKDELSKKDYVKSVEYISKEEAINRMKEDLGEDFLQWLGDVENPLLPSLDIRFVADYANSDSMAVVERWVGKKTIVKEVIYQKSLTNTINENIGKIKIILFAVSLILLLIAISLISHTIRLSIYASRFTVRTMCLVGATRAFIMKPFVKTYMLQGLIAAMVALVSLTIILYGLTDYIPAMDFSQTKKDIAVIYVAMLALSLLMTFFATLSSMRRYLNADIDKFYM
ncbi:MAG: permease-like cell division protein FtsX [Bacteroidales bacterium]|nr:permease-like cell division protein FtsX [Bacteroidales bacterium]